MINYLVRGGHNWDDILDKYSVTTVKNLYIVGREHDKMEHLQFVTGMSVAVLDAIDMSFNKGKGKVLSSYYKAMKQATEKEKMLNEPIGEVKKPVVGNSVLALFNALPKKEITDELG